MFRLTLLMTSFWCWIAVAKLSVITTTADLNALVTEIGNGRLTSESIARGNQDVHYIEAKPSFAIKTSRADLVISIGLGLEDGWLPAVLQSSRNPKIQASNTGYLAVGPLVSVLELPTAPVSRDMGDVHPEGNPHFMLDPIRAGDVAIAIAKRLGELDSSNSSVFHSRAKQIQSRFQSKTKEWKARIERTGVSRVITHHKTLTYFFDRFGIENPAILEPKPGIPPTTKHTLEVIRIMKEKKVPLILVENYFDDATARRIRSEIPGIRSELVPVSVGGEPTIEKLDDLYERLVLAIEKKDAAT